MTKKVIINADDYGISDGVCTAILDLLSINAISNTTMMLCASGASRRIENYGIEKVRHRAGVHLQLTNGRPITRASLVPSLVDRTGSFHDPRKMIVDVTEVEVEWRAQIELAFDLLGVKPTHIDSHHGMHRLPHLFPLYCDLASEYSIPFRGANNEVRDVVLAKKLAGTTALVKGWTGRCLGADALISETLNISSKFADSEFIEIVSHPGHPDDHLATVSSWNKNRLCDYQGLKEISENQTLEKNGFLRSTFEELYEWTTR